MQSLPTIALATAAALALGGCASPDFGKGFNRSDLEISAPPRHAPKPKPRPKTPPAKRVAPAKPAALAAPCAAPATAERRLLCHGYFPKGGAQ
jgi:hypothetical protein